MLPTFCPALCISFQCCTWQYQIQYYRCFFGASRWQKPNHGHKAHASGRNCGHSTMCLPVSIPHITAAKFVNATSALSGGHLGRPRVHRSILKPDSLSGLSLWGDGVRPDWAVVWTDALTDALKPQVGYRKRPSSSAQDSLQACRTKLPAYGCLS